MANISDACGWFTIRTKSEKTVKDLIHLMQHLEWDGDYMTLFTDFHRGDDQFDTKIHEADDGFYEFSTSFASSGRWCYIENIKSMADWILGSIEIKRDFDSLLLALNVSKEDYSILFEFTDYEKGQEFFYDAEVEFRHRANNPFDMNEVKVVSCEDIELTVVNYASKMDYGFYETIDELYLDNGEEFESFNEDRRQQIINDIMPQIGEIENYFGEPFDKLKEGILW